MDPALREKVAQHLEKAGVFDKTAAGMGPLKDAFRGAGGKVKNFLLAHRGKLGLIGGAGAMGGVASMGKQEQGAQQEAAELNQLLEAYPELLYDTPTPQYSPEPEPRVYGGYPGQY
jgi:hypothetical protein